MVNNLSYDNTNTERLTEGDTEPFYEKTVSLLHDGELIKGKVISVTKDEVIVDIGYKSEGHIPIKEFRDAKGALDVKAGDEIEVLLESSDDDRGYVILSREKANKIRMWNVIEESCNTGKTIEGKIIQKVKGGFSVDLNGIPAFLPGSQADIRPITNPDKLIDSISMFKVIQYDKRKSNIVVSRRTILEAEREKTRKDTMQVLEEGKVVDGIVKNITDYGVFVDLGGVDGLVHITDMSWGKSRHPSHIFKVGDRITVKILKFNKEENKIALGFKQLKPNPWDTVQERYKAGDIIKGRVVKVVDYGIFMELEEGLEGLIHLSELSWAKAKQATQRFKQGDIIEARLLSVDSLSKKISLSLKQLEHNPWDEMGLKYPKGTRVRGVVKNVTDFGVFIGIEEGVDGLVHISDVSWKKIKHPSELFQKGQELEAEVVGVDKEKERVALSIKALIKDPWYGVSQKYQPGLAVNGTVTNIANFGAFVELEDGVEGLIHISELKRGEKKGITIKAGDTVEVEVLNIDPQERKIGFGLKGLISAGDKTAG